MVVDHVNPTSPVRTRSMPDAGAARQVEYFAENARDFGIEIFDVLDPRQGIEHVVAPEQGLALPGMIVAGGDSHTRGPAGRRPRPGGTQGGARGSGDDRARLDKPMGTPVSGSIFSRIVNIHIGPMPLPVFAATALVACCRRHGGNACRCADACGDREF
jgi:hypothetical protein